MPFGVVRQLFETAVRALSPGDRTRMFAGAAAPAQFLLDPTDEPAGGGPADPGRSGRYNRTQFSACWPRVIPRRSMNRRALWAISM